MHPVEKLWHHRGAVPAAARLALAPLGLLYGGAMRARRALYDAGILRSIEPELPVVSVGNLTVGGTGKTPVAAWVAARLRERARPAILLRGYGDDEVHVHARLNPGIPVIAGADRVEGVRMAREAGADIVVADDAFQHRRLRRALDIVLLSVEQMRRPRHVLPAGPWRESLSASARADLIVLTRKSASVEEARAARGLLPRAAKAPVAVVHLAPHELVSATGSHTAPLESLRGRDTLAIAAVGDPDAFRRQLEQSGANVELAAFRDHHAFTRDEAVALARRVPLGGLVVCTLKDAVKLAELWPASTPLWYVSQRLVVDEGAEHLNRLLYRALDARTGATNTAG